MKVHSYLIRTMIILFAFISLSFSEITVNLSGSSLTSLNRNKSDLQLGMNASYFFSKWFSFSLGYDYSFKHNINNSNKKSLFLIVSDTNQVISEYYIENYKEAGYCFVFKTQPIFTIGNISFGIGAGFESGQFESSYKVSHTGKETINFNPTNNDSFKDHYFIFFSKIGYRFEPILASIEFDYKENKEYLLGLSIELPLFKFSLE